MISLTLTASRKLWHDITKNKDKLGFSAFTSAGMTDHLDWRFKTHLANLPIYYEYKDEGIDNTDAIKGTYLDTTVRSGISHQQRYLQTNRTFYKDS